MQCTQLGGDSNKRKEKWLAIGSRRGVTKHDMGDRLVSSQSGICGCLEDGVGKSVPWDRRLSIGF